MQLQKLENQLQLALSLPEEERAKTGDLNVGYLPSENAWELIVNYYGDIEAVAAELPARVVTLLDRFAILTVDEEQIGRLTEYPEVLFVEKPKQLFTEITAGRIASCVEQVQSDRLPENERLFGEGVLIAVPDSGVDYRHPDFRNEDGSTRIVAYWDQTLGAGDNRYRLGTIFTQTAINEALETNQVITSDGSGHGTAVAGVAAGNGRASGGRNRGMAPRAELLVVRLAPGTTQGFARTTTMMMAIDFCLRSSMALAKPVAINLSFGNNYGSHTGKSLLEDFMNTAAESYRASLIVGTGNEGVTAKHARVTLRQPESGSGETGIFRNTQEVRFAIGGGEASVSLQIWKSYVDEFRVELVSPAGTRQELLERGITTSLQFENTKVVYLYAEPKPYSAEQEILLELLPVEGLSFLDVGIWTVRLLPARIVAGTVDFWLPVAETGNIYTQFLNPDPEISLTIPSTAFRAISVSAYNVATGRYAAFSGQGFLRGGGVKPDLTAPGVDVMTPSMGGGYSQRSGTSFAAPFVTGGAALLLEWGIVKGNDPYLYGEKLKAYLIRGARQLPGMESPNPMTGWGALCVRDSLPS